MNLSFLESSIPSISSYPGLLPTLTTLLSEGVNAKAGSGKSESVRWAAGLLKNLSRDKEAAIDIAETRLVREGGRGIRERQRRRGEDEREGNDDRIRRRENDYGDHTMIE
jgi:hypothetical protein